MKNSHEKGHSVDSHTVAKGALAMFLPLAVLILGTAAGVYWVSTSATRRVLNSETANLVNMQSRQIGRDIEAVSSDLALLPARSNLTTRWRALEISIPPI